MCGIAGIWGSMDETTVKRMMGLLSHRGPDAEGIYVSPGDEGVLGHRRLSIMDPERGNQPIFSEDCSKAVIANGEIYNFPSLLPDLSRSHSFMTASDTEAILHLYEDHGPSAVEYLDGMYAFAIADDRNLFAVRDPIGIKPLYYGEKDGAFLFASELKALAPYCNNISEFPPGTFFHSKTGFTTFYHVPEVLPQRAPVKEYIQKLRETLEQAVTKRLMSDVPLGAFLSGGLDSSIIAALARKHMDKLHTFSVGVKGSNDLEAARLVSRKLDTIHHEYVLDADEVKAKLPEIIYYLESFDQDLVRSAIPCYFTSRLAANHVKVILTGEGADELFAGYTYYKAIPGLDSLHLELRRSVASLHNLNLQRVDRMTMAHSIEGRVPFLDLQMILLGQLIPTELKLFRPSMLEKWILRKAFEDLLPADIIWREKEQFDEGSGTLELLNKTLTTAMNKTESIEYRSRYPGEKLRSSEECYYHRLFMEVFENPNPILMSVGRWSHRPLWAA
ncbi:MAG: asparagine synthase B [Deltaproteobacteria bacterium]|mgnify:CR=1 FL=1|nr:asparagine synthase B [Deltaproteobacteria bacterium]RLB22755.1 MAG: asparagine synthetase B [Deltaproteobacteria bacterium]